MNLPRPHRLRALRPNRWASGLDILRASAVRRRGVRLVVLLLVVLLLAGCERRARQAASAEGRSTGPVPDQVSWDVRYAVTEGGQPRALIRAARMARFETADSTYTVLTGRDTTRRDTVGRDTVGRGEAPYDSATQNAADRTAAEREPTGQGAGTPVPEPEATDALQASASRADSTRLPRRVRTVLFDIRGDSSAVLRADRIVYYEKERRYDAFGNVIVVTTDGKRLESEKLTWLEEAREIRTRRFVRITTPTEQVQGNGLVADEDLETYQIGRFTAEVEVGSEDASAEQ
jgi:hypothetical protein